MMEIKIKIWKDESCENKLQLNKIIDDIYDMFKPDSKIGKACKIINLIQIENFEYENVKICLN